VASYVSQSDIGSTNSSSDPAVFTMPTVTLEADDFLVALLAVRGGDTTIINSPSTGWTKPSEGVSVNVTAAPVYKKWASGDSLSVDLDIARKWAGGIMAFRGVDTISPISAWAGPLANASSLVRTAPAVTPAHDGTMIAVLIASVSESVGTPTSPTFNQRLYLAASSGSNVSVVLGNEPGTAAGVSTGTNTTTYGTNTNASVGYTFALKSADAQDIEFLGFIPL